MKQMINNHREIESLEDFIYYDKSTGKIKITKPIVDGSGNSLTVKKDILGQISYHIFDEGEETEHGGFIGDLNLLNGKVYEGHYDFLIFTTMYSMVMFIPNLENDSIGVMNLVKNSQGETQVVRVRSKKLQAADEPYEIHLDADYTPSFSTENLYGVLIGIKL